MVLRIMPASKLFTFILKAICDVTTAINPAVSIATRIPITGDIPIVIRLAQIAPPKGYAPSAVKSGKLRKRNGIIIPKAMIARVRPCNMPV
jgi:hypothetical protein